eukprot:COSAG02_NODE_4696_length_5085_cov_2.504813_5_plen_50_part_00
MSKGQRQANRAFFAAFVNVWPTKHKREQTTCLARLLAKDGRLSTLCHYM